MDGILLSLVLGLEKPVPSFDYENVHQHKDLGGRYLAANLVVLGAAHLFLFYQLGQASVGHDPMAASPYLVACSAAGIMSWQNQEEERQVVWSPRALT